MRTNSQTVDPMMQMAKANVVAGYHAKSAELDRYMRLEVLRVRGVRPFVVDALRIGEYDADYPNEWLFAELYTPQAVSGGILRLVWRRYAEDGETELETSVLIADWENFRSSSREYQAAGAAYRELATRLYVAVQRKLHPEDFAALEARNAAAA